MAIKQSQVTGNRLMEGKNLQALLLDLNLHLIDFPVRIDDFGSKNKDPDSR